MSLTALALLGYITWTILLLLAIAALRLALVLGGRRGANSFAADGADVSPFAQRLARAHANCYESFPILGGLLLVALATWQTRLTDPLALMMLAARVAQSFTHLLSGGVLASLIRFFFFAIQLGIALRWLFLFLTHWTAF
ncbi:MAPEG family protein [Janthinobacterium fluminis]|uniref:MAPEG family protein n=1 Tax=Janthinobacterium fluminis TaxID=2987524 RepID=A0ABT5K5W2_9BURK|nr:MAPEG family protein [Janthinobacterium fluminis]MDC8759805.1 MAPEG family protein [Janthinobacterium fluminis]